MPDFKVTFRGDLGNLSQFDAAVRNSALTSARAIEAANQKIASSVGKITGAYSSSAGAGLFVQKQRSIADAVNNTFQQSGNIVRRYVKDYELQFDRLGKAKVVPIFDDAYLSSFKKAQGNLEAYNEAIKKTAAGEAELMRGRRAFASGTARRNNLGVDLKEQVKQQQALLGGASGSVLANAISEANRLQTQLTQVMSGKNSPQRNILAKQIRADLQAVKSTIASERLPIQTEIARLEKELAKLSTLQSQATARQARLERNIPRRQAFRDVKSTLDATPPIQADLARALQESPDLRKRLLQGGLGLGQQYGNLDFQRALAQQEASVSSYTRNLRTNVRTIAGEFKDASGLINRFTVDVDDQGKVIGRWGGQLAGAGNTLKQTVRDFQKVIEWTIATTVVFGTLATVIGQLQNINELNTLLTRFSITAQSSVGETQQLFKELTQVAYDTATPLMEIITVADDIALATRDANQSTEEWHNSIIDLTTAVGIFTNLTGKDTVAAADQLSSAFKQLDIAPGDLVGLLNKVTAVSGGQANAIADIVQSISGLAEAARAAGFSIDEQIAGVQVLSQVTNKTSAEIATSFKNLFGSVTSVGSEKILAQFNIQVRDAEGGVRDFLDIYRDVADALEKGIIPQNRLPDVLRGISGGPRRAPDAAALLANIGRIDEVVQKSQNASNEALIANARVLDTNQARIIQFQNSIDAAVFEEFGEAVKNVTKILTDFGIAFAGVLSGINPEITTLALQLGLMVGGLLAVNKVGGFLLKGLGLNINALRSFTAQAKIATGASINLAKGQAQADARLTASGLIIPNGVSTFGPAATAAPRTLRSSLRGIAGSGIGRAGALAVGATAAGLGAAATGNNDAAQTIGTILQVGGALATLSGALAPVGIAAIAAGTALQLFTGNTDQAKQKTADLSSEVYTLSQGIQETNLQAAAYAKEQRKSLDIIESLRGKTEKTADEQLRLSDATSRYVTATLGLASANKSVGDSFDALIAKIPQLASKYQDFLTLTNPNDPRLKDLQQRIATDILKGSGQAIYSGTPVGTANQFRNFGGGQSRDLSAILDDPNKLFNLLLPPRLTSRGGTGGAQPFVPQTEVELRTITSALRQLIEAEAAGTGTMSAEQLDKLIQAVTQFSQAASSFSQNQTALAQQAALIQAKSVTGEFNTQQSANATLANNLATLLNNASAGYTPPAVSQRQGEQGVTAEPLRQQITLIEELSAAAEKGTQISTNMLVDIAETALELNNTYESLKEGGDAALNEGILQTLQEAGVAQEVLDELAKRYNITLQETLATNEALVLSLDAAKRSAAETFGQRQLQLEIAENSGQFEDNAKGLAILKEQNQQAYSSTLQLIDAVGQLGQGAFVDLTNTLSQVIGLQGIYISQTELNRVTSLDAADQTQYWADLQATLSQKLIDGAVAAGVNADGIQKITEEALRVTAALSAIPKYTGIIVEIQTLYTQRGSREGGFSLSPALQNQYTEELEKQNEAFRKNQSSELEKTIKAINNIMRSGSGSNLGSAGAAAKAAKAAAPYNKPGLLDVPEEIVNASNRDALLKQAIKNAKALQSIVPGEAKQNQSDIVELLNGTQRLLETRGIGEEYLRRAMDELTEQIKKQNELLTKADTIRRLRVQGGGFAALGSIPVNSVSGVSVGGANGPIDVNLNLNGTVLTPAQFSQFADLVAASIKRQIAA